MAEAWKPKLAGVDLKQLTLSPLEGFLASRIDGRTTVAELSALTNLPAERVEVLLGQLVTAGAVEAVAAPAPPSIAPLVPPIAPLVAPPVLEPVTEPDAPLLEPEPSDEAEAPMEEDGQGPTHLALYRERFHGQPEDARVQAAATAIDPELSALCFDPLPAVVRTLLQNPHFGLAHARLVAAHHQNGVGLEFLVARAELARDAQVQRLLFRNPQLNEGQLKRLTASKRLLELWKLAISREAQAKTRTGASRFLRQRFATTTAEEKVEVIFNSDGRALGALSGVPVDGKTTALLCARTYSSMTLVQHLAHWSNAPPALVAHLLKQPVVVRSPQLKMLLGRHPNAPKGRPNSGG